MLALMCVEGRYPSSSTSLCLPLIPDSIHHPAGAPQLPQLSPEDDFKSRRCANRSCVCPTTDRAGNEASFTCAWWQTKKRDVRLSTASFHGIHTYIYLYMYAMNFSYTHTSYCKTNTIYLLFWCAWCLRDIFAL